MYDELVKRLWHLAEEQMFDFERKPYLQAANAIEELSKLNAEITKRELKLRMEKPRWIPVTERLPEKDKLVLVWRTNQMPYVSRRSDSTYWLGLGRDAGVTHWMPLPEPPKEEI